jgi:hypothetical protein
MWEAYSNYKENRGSEIPGYIVLSSRESYKTLTESAFAVLMMCHFGATVAHMAAIEQQAKKAVEYISTFIIKVTPYLKANGRIVNSSNKREISIVNKDGTVSNVIVIIATLQGANAQHTNLFHVDEVDVMRFPQAYEEAKMIPGVFNGQFPLTIKTSTRKFAFGLMEKEIQRAPTSGERLLRWNIMDVTERCLPSRHKPDQPKVVRYVGQELPLQNLSEEEFGELQEEKKAKYDKVEAYQGCASCTLLQTCQTRLAHRPEGDVGGMYKPIPFVINQFKKIDPDMGEAQLLCNKPSMAGLIYKRFDETEVTGNTLTIRQAWEEFSGEPAPSYVEDNSEHGLRKLMTMLLDKGLRFKASVDWGTRHFFVITVHVLVPSGDWWIFDCEAISGLDPEEMLKYGIQVNETYNKVKYYPDNASPGYIKMFRKNHLPCVDFKKDIQDGIRAVKAYIIDGVGRRRLKVIKHPKNQVVIDMFKNHHYKLDPAGNPTKEPDDEEYADIGDTVRYMGQNMPFKKSGLALIPTETASSIPQPKPMPMPDSPFSSALGGKIRELTSGGQIEGVRNRSGSIIVDFTGDDDLG